MQATMGTWKADKEWNGKGEFKREFVNFGYWDGLVRLYRIFSFQCKIHFFQYFSQVDPGIIWKKEEFTDCAASSGSSTAR